IIVEKSQSLKQEQQQRLQDFSVDWCNLEEITPNSIIGCFFSNELVDAFPVHQFILDGGELREIYVTVEQKPEEENSALPIFIEIMAEPSTPQLGEYFKLVGIDLSQNTYENGYRSEINLAALNWLGIV
ncbi:MAG: SAM-dependent methyltransferase, partial [Dolichospermum sp.]